MGTIRVFAYPCESSAGLGYSFCYCDHLPYVNICVISPDKKYLITSSEQDRCIFIWNVVVSQEFDEEQAPEEGEQITNFEP